MKTPEPTSQQKTLGSLPRYVFVICRGGNSGTGSFPPPWTCTLPAGTHGRCPITAGVHFHPSVKVVARGLLYSVPLLLVISKYFVEGFQNNVNHHFLMNFDLFHYLLVPIYTKMASYFTPWVCTPLLPFRILTFMFSQLWPVGAPSSSFLSF